MKMESYKSKEQMFGLMLFLVNVIMQFGICSMECNFQSVGPSCNFKNIAYGKESRHDSNTNPPHFSYTANDNNISTCSYTSDRNTNAAAPWLNLWIPEKTTFKKLEIVTTESHRWDLQHFEVLVFNTTEYNFILKEPLTDGLLCYKHNASIPQETKIEVTCDGFPYGNLIRIQLHSKHFQLVLCDFRLYGECQNDFYGNGCEKCSENCLRSGNRYCNVNDGTCLRGCYPGWTGDRCKKECNNGYYGQNCTTRCSSGCQSSGRNAQCDKVNGMCLNGCNAGYKGSFCDQECEIGKWGKDCSTECGKCESSTCDRKTGMCPQGCSVGFKPSLCSQECQNGTWGKNCEQACGNCDNSTCDRFNGVCPGGCSAGYTGFKCIDECQNGFYGKNCRSQCNNRCSRYVRKAICDKVNGTCLNGCTAGYKGSFCDEECEDGKWGKGCQQDCGNCLSSPCNNVNGYCSGGCAPGYKHSGNCIEACSSGEWGDNCRNVCGKCKNEEICRKNDGICEHGCIPGHKHTDLCNEECKNGTYGEACGRNCSHACIGVCNKVNGTCDQCQAGWTGDFCDNVQTHRAVKHSIYNDEITNLKFTSISIGILCVALLSYATVITVFYKHKAKQNAALKKELDVPKCETAIALSSDQTGQEQQYTELNPQGTEETPTYETLT